ncbi:MAG: ATP-dependent zinc protease [Gammaproteobacteria bacterium]|nr:RimK/LysX family protein [Gammaproteobacteria bacterium]NNM00885.1 ATP-dependent zinc protease [Gammaproteobacteria bacterium]
MASPTDDDADRAARADMITVGWREWVALPDLAIPAIKAKIDTGARTSALHAFAVDRYTERGAPWVHLRIHPRQRNLDAVIKTDVPIIDERVVSDSGGHREKRIVVASALLLGGRSWPIELTVTGRDRMLFRLLIGRTAMAGRMLVDPRRSYLTGKPPKKKKKKSRRKDA